MKKVFLSLAVIAALTVVSCKQSENAEAPVATDSTTTEVMDSATKVMDSATQVMDSAATKVEAAADATKAAAEKVEAAAPVKK